MGSLQGRAEGGILGLLPRKEGVEEGEGVDPYHATPSLCLPG